MAKEVLNKILELESKAEKILEDARLEAAHVERGSKEKKEDIITQSAEEKKKKREQVLKKAGAKAQAEIKSINDDLKLTLKGVEKRAKKNIKQAKELVVKEMKKKLCL